MRTAATTSLARRAQRFHPDFNAHDVASPRIQVTHHGLRIGQLSDIHVRAGVRPRRLEHAVDLMNEAKPDFVALTGDYVCASALPVRKLTDSLRRLHAPAFATLGNHDHWAGANKVRHALEQAGVDVLTNEHRRLSLQGRSPLHLVGIDDSVTRHHDPEKAFRDVPHDETTVVLSHDPKSADFLWRYRPALILSGHTHGGQLYVPRVTEFLSSRIGIKYLAGFFDIEGSVLFVNRGLGASIPLRFAAPMEVAVLTLRAHA
jgi:predicted MPP superfamily phosphohydrolase